MASRQRFFYLFGSIFGLCGGVSLLIGVLMLFSQRELLAEGVRAEGEVIRLVGSDTLAPVVRFSAEDGRTVEFVSPMSSNPPAFEVGERVEVLPDRLLLYADDGEQAAAAVHDRGLTPDSVLVRRAGLEDVFLRLTGRTLVD